jgi:hypothetical protein
VERNAEAAGSLHQVDVEHDKLARADRLHAVKRIGQKTVIFGRAAAKKTKGNSIAKNMSLVPVVGLRHIDAQC